MNSWFFSLYTCVNKKKVFSKHILVILCLIFIMESTLQKKKHDPGHPGGFGGVNKLYRAVRDSTGVTGFKDFGQDVYTLHAEVAKHFPRNRVLVSTVDKQFQADLIDMSRYSSDNDNVIYMFWCSCYCFYCSTIWTF